MRARGANTTNHQANRSLMGFSSASSSFDTPPQLHRPYPEQTAERRTLVTPTQAATEIDSRSKRINAHSPAARQHRNTLKSTVTSVMPAKNSKILHI